MRDDDQAEVGDAQPGIVSQVALEVGAPPELLGDHLRMLICAARQGRRPTPEQLATIRQQGRRAAEDGLGADRAVELYLATAWRLWEAMPVAEGQDVAAVRRSAGAVLRVVNESVSVLVDGHQAARRELIRREESLRREFVDDLLRGDANVSLLVDRAQPFGMDLGRAHRVLLAEQRAPSPVGLDRVAGSVERAVVDRFGDREVLVATKDAYLVVVVPGHDPSAGDDAQESADVVRRQLGRLDGQDRWRVGAGRPHAGPYGVATSYEEAREVLGLARRLGLDPGTLHPRDLLLYRVVARDQAALVELVDALLTPLTTARGGAEPLLSTLDAYFRTGRVATETARALHLSVRAVTYRLDRVTALTGADPTDPAAALTLQVAVLGARLLGWPSTRA